MKIKDFILVIINDCLLFKSKEFGEMALGVALWLAFAFLAGAIYIMLNLLI